MPCPVCTGPIHPIAGKCKHCKSDLRAIRGPRAQATAQLPSLAPAQPGQPAASPFAPSKPAGNGVATGPAVAVTTTAATTAYANGHGTTNGTRTNGHARTRGYDPSPSREPMITNLPAGYDRSSAASILPPRMTGSHPAAAPVDQRSALRHWPIVVIVLAVVAILAAIALLVWPPSNDAAAPGKKVKSALDGPAPEHMDTNALPPEPPKPPVTPQRLAVPPQPPPAPPPPVDPWNAQGNLTPPLQSNDLDDPRAPNDSSAITLRVLQRECATLRGCGTADDTQCTAIENTPAPPLPASCPAAAECLRQINRMTCTQLDPDNLLEPLGKLSECRDATRC